MKVDFIVPTRNKVAHIEKCFASLAAQTYSPMRIVFFDQASTDGTLEKLHELIAGYTGPNTFQVLSCPPHGQRGMIGLACDFNWIHTQIDGDIVLVTSADDFCEPERAAVTVAAFEETDASWVSVCQMVASPEGVVRGITSIPDRGTRWVTAAEAVEHQIGSSGTQAWARDLWDKHGPLEGMEQIDVVLPIMALVERGMYFVDDPLHTYVEHADEANTGGGGQVLAAEKLGDDVALAVEAQDQIGNEGGIGVTGPPGRRLAHQVLRPGHGRTHLHLDRVGRAPADQHPADGEGDEQHQGDGGDQP